MAWVRLDDSFSEHPKVHRVGPLGAALFVRLLCYANRAEKDGVVPARQVMADAGWCTDSGELGKPKQLVESMVAAGLLEVTADGYQIHDYLLYQPSKQEIEQKRAIKSAAGKAGGQASAQARASTGAQATGSAGAKAKLNPVPVSRNPYPDPVNRDVCKPESVE